MRAVAVTPGAAGSLQLLEVPEPEVGPQEVLVQVERVGICGTDMAIAGGMHCQAPFGSDYLVIGHESLGWVIEPGNGDNRLSVGDYVVATVRRPCAHLNCHPCRTGHTDMCFTGDFTERGILARHGFLAEYYAEDPAFLVPVPHELAHVGVLLEPLTVPEKGLRQVWKIQERLPWQPKKAVVLGAGPIGLLTAMLLRLRDVETWVFDLAPPEGTKAGIVGQLGATFVNTADVPVSTIAGALGPVDLLVEATGHAPLAFDAYSQLSNNGALCLLGVAGAANTVTVEPHKFNNALVTGNRVIVGSVNANPVDFQSGIADLARIEARWPGIAATLLNRQVPLNDFQTAFQRTPDDIKVTVSLV